MVQSKYSPEEALQRIKLMMEYDLSKTSTENKKVVSEQTLHPGYTDPNKQKDIRRGDSPLIDILKNQDLSRSACRQHIQKYYDTWLEKTEVPADILQKSKNIVQKCANQHFGKFGIGGEKFDNYINVLSGRHEDGIKQHGDDKHYMIQKPRIVNQK